MQGFLIVRNYASEVLRRNLKRDHGIKQPKRNS